MKEPEKALIKRSYPTPHDLTPLDMPLQVFSAVCQEPRTAESIAKEIKASSTAKVHHVLNVLRSLGLIQYHSYEIQPPTRQSRKKQHFRTEIGRIASIGIHRKLVEQSDKLRSQGEPFRQEEPEDPRSNPTRDSWGNPSD